MSSAELSARRTAAAAALADFHREADAFGVDGALAYRLAAELASLLEQLDTEQPGPLEQLGGQAIVRQLDQIRLILDSFDWESDDRQYALEQIHEVVRGDL